MIVKDDTREEAIQSLIDLLNPESGDPQALVVQGPPNNLEFLVQVLQSQTFETGRATTEWIDSGEFTYTPR